VIPNIQLVACFIQEPRNSVTVQRM